jgi:hypothetical protein
MYHLYYWNISQDHKSKNITKITHPIENIYELAFDNWIQVK